MISGDIVPVGGEYGTALQTASFLGILEIVTLLLDNGADPTVEGAELLWPRMIHIEISVAGGKYGTALQAAAVTDLNELPDNSQRFSLDVRPRIVALLLKKGAAPNARGSGFVLTLKIYADMLPVGGRYGTALQAAAATGVDKYANEYYGFEGDSLEASLKILTLLLEKGADPNVQGAHFLYW
jgi:ankyrin repeat protein